MHGFDSGPLFLVSEPALYHLVTLVPHGLVERIWLLCKSQCMSELFRCYLYRDWRELKAIAMEFTRQKSLR